MHSRLEAISDGEREKYVCATLPFSHHIRSAIHLVNYLSSRQRERGKEWQRTRARGLCVPISASICKQHRMSLILSIYLSHTVKPIGAGTASESKRERERESDQVSTCVCLFRFFTHEIWTLRLEAKRENLTTDIRSFASTRQQKSLNKVNLGFFHRRRD